MRDSTWSYIPGKPITKREDLPKPIVTKKIDPEQQEFINKKFWALKYDGDFNELVSIKSKGEIRRKAQEHMRQLFELRTRLLLFGGAEVCLPAIEEDIHWLLNFGEIWLPKNHKHIKGIPSNCHANAAKLWDKDREKYRIATGYYLHDDGMWRQHSWCLEKQPKQTRVVETTEVGVLYFGVAKSPQLCEEFLHWNL